MIDFLGIGDVTSDSFITLSDAEIHCNPEKASCKMSIPWGSKIPYKELEVVHGVGNSANACVAAARLGMKSSLVAAVGKDDGGYQCREHLAAEGVDITNISIQEGKTTNHHYVLSFEAERTILVRHESFAYTLPKEHPSIIYLSSLSEGTESFHDDIVEWLSESDSFVAYQPGTFQLRMGIEPLKKLYERCHLFICNKEEAMFLLETDMSDVPSLCRMMIGHGPSIVSITDGPNGAFIASSYSNDIWYMPQYPDPAPPKERTGAGDAYSTTLAVYIGGGMAPEQALRRAPINSMSVVQKVGAQAGLINRDQINTFLTTAPDEYRLEKIES